MHIVHIASEMAPLAKVGGLADVILGLCRELSQKGHDVDIIIPKYDCMDSNEVRDLTIEVKDLLSFYDGEWYSNTVWVGWVQNLKVYFIDPHHPKHYFNRGCFYGCEDDTERYLYFSRAAIEFLMHKKMTPHVIHSHDWQTAAIAPLCRDVFNCKQSKCVFTIHNIDYQGRCASWDLDRVGITSKTYSSMQDPIYPEALNLLKGAITFCDRVTTVSPTYSKEVLTPAGGKGLETVLNTYKNKFSGILNGIDYEYWNPEKDPCLPANYSFRELPDNKNDRNTLDKKAFIKRYLRERLNLVEEYRPLIGVVSRLIPQKGIELIKHAMFRCVDQGCQFVLLGTSPIPSINAEFHSLKHQFADHPNISLTLHHQEELAHLIYAGSDMFLVPSIFEPCGLTQMIALRYGSVPIVRKTGGLADTIFDVDHSGLPFDKTNGYVFEHADNAGIDSALDRAIRCWFQEPDRWRRLLINGMQTNNSWDKSADAYLALYEK
jgi:starch synthase